ncbi:MAG TPA: cytochrome c3 family protein, partial [Kofleriaceae bacterium]|nr:cytochrome c3 family protein [Kofleriaceae bacterium]
LAREPDKGELARAQFSHASHAGADCKACHALTRSGEPGQVGSGHEPCADSGCHADDFGAAEPRICTTCHVRGEPWRDLHLDPQPTGPSDFLVGFSHRAHLSGAAPRVEASCARCHLATAAGSFGAAPGHTACSGGGCHGAAATPAPALGDCAACHRDGASATRRPRGRWSVRARFTHARHLTEPGAPDRPVPCTDCHGAALEADSVAAVRPPAKRTCARCHDGGAAFKLTGHACGRCHSPGAPRRARGSR